MSIPNTPPENNHQTNGKRRKVIIRLIAFLVIFTLLTLLYWFFFIRNWVSTDDSYVNGYVINITSEISATTTSFYADNSDFVKKGELLVQLDPTDYMLKFEEAKAALALAVRQVVNLEQAVLETKAAFRSAKADHKRSLIDFENRQALVDSLAITHEDYEHSKIQTTASKALVSLYYHKVQAAIAALGTTPLDSHPIVENAKSVLRQAYVNLRRTCVFAPLDGFIAKRNIEIGKWVKPGDVMMAIISLHDVWVDANFKETQLKNIRVGQSVSISSDLYGSLVDYKGTVLGLVPGTGSVFSLLPPQNATGNWIKIVQRVPVRILLEKEQIKKFPLLLGLSTYTTVDIADRSGPFLREVSAGKAIAATTIYDIDMKKVDALINEIISSNTQVK